jgi:hypothetical protein
VNSLNTARLPQRPDATVISDSIPLFYIGRNRNGFWVVREAEGRIGGLFLLKSSALRFARQNSRPAGCATMFVTEPLELNTDDQGSRPIAPIAALIGIRCAVRTAANAKMTLAKWLKLATSWCVRSLSSVRATCRKP